ncbi:hypothetical protein BKA70DRAFT_1426095 [Coprinopsis sp. MPI-PUGE-AT-0042]|nr:hypothetical protein BKA70DRAFT_1426095 [Coprinopsis sp. MPI-PUGE-AT-0042]
MSARANEGCELTTSLVYKPKTPTSTNPVLVTVIAREVTETNSGATGKQHSLKEQGFIGAFWFRQASLFPVDMTLLFKIVTLLAQTTPTLPSMHLHRSSSSSVFVSRDDIVNHLKSLETELTKLGGAQRQLLQRGCHLLTRWSYSIWEATQKLGVQNSPLPMIMYESVLERDKDHIEDVSRCRMCHQGPDLEEPIAVRPSSETCNVPVPRRIDSQPSRSPLLKQWHIVVGREFKNPQPFLHTHTTAYGKEADNIEVREILDLYRQDLLAIPVIPGVKSEKAGGLYITALEGFIPTSGHGIPVAISHCLGQNLSKPETFTSLWRIRSTRASTRLAELVGCLDKSDWLVLPLRAASVQTVIVLCEITTKTSDEQRANINNACEELAQTLRKAGVKAKADLRDGYPLGYKYSDWEQKSVPFRLEIGPDDLAKKQTLTVRRNTSAKNLVPLGNIGFSISSILETIQADMFATAKKTYWEHVETDEAYEDDIKVVVDNLLTHAMNDKVDGDHSDGGEQEPVHPSNQTTTISLSSRVFLQPGLVTNGLNKQKGVVSLSSTKQRVHVTQLHHFTRSHDFAAGNELLQHCLQRDLLEPADLDHASTPPNPTSTVTSAHFFNASRPRDRCFSLGRRLYIRRLQQPTTVNDTPIDKPRRLDQRVPKRS